MALRSGGRKLSFEILLGQSPSSEEDGHGDRALLRRSNSDPNSHSLTDQSTGTHKLVRKKRKKRKKPAARMAMAIDTSIPENSIAGNGFGFGFGFGPAAGELAGSGERFCGSGGADLSRVTAAESEPPSSPASFQNSLRGGELRQRSVNGGGDGGAEEASSRVSGDGMAESGVEVSSAGRQRSEANGSVAVTKLESAESLDWKRLMAEDPDCE